MKIYGSETLNPKVRTDLLYPDIDDIKTWGRGCGRIPNGSEGDQRGYWKNKDAKATARRYLKRLSRQEARNHIRQALIDINTPDIEFVDYMDDVEMEASFNVYDRC